MVVVERWPNHGEVARSWSRRGDRRRGQTIAGDASGAWATGTSHVVCVLLGGDGFPVVDLGHPPDASASQARVLVAVAPAVDRALDETSFASKARVQFSQRPADRVAFCLVDKTVSSVLLLAAAGTGVDAVLRLEVVAEVLHIDGLDIAPDGILELDAITRVFERDPLDTVPVLPHDERSCGRDGPRSRVRVRP